MRPGCRAEPNQGLGRGLGSTRNLLLFALNTLHALWIYNILRYSTIDPQVWGTQGHAGISKYQPRAMKSILDVGFLCHLKVPWLLTRGFAAAKLL